MYKEVIKELKKAKTIYIATHVNPDGDAIGSSLALCIALKKMGKNAKVIIPSHADNFSFLPGLSEKVSKIEEEEIDLLIFLDSSDITRIAIAESDIAKAKRTVCIDHHKTNAKYTDVAAIDEKSPATAELIFNLISALKIKLDKDIATNIYAGILTDTGSFKYSSTRKETFQIGSKLIDTEIDFSEIARKLLDTWKESKLKLVGKYINNIETVADGKIVYSLVNRKILDEIKISDEDAEGMANYGLKIDYVEVSIYVREKQDGTFKVSMRSKTKVDLAEIALMFGGGGHSRAAGCTFTKEDLEENKEKLINLIKEQL